MYHWLALLIKEVTVYLRAAKPHARVLMKATISIGLRRLAQILLIHIEAILI
jgi:hypothetical protein